MAYGQTGTGKTYTLGRLGKNDASERGIMVRALEDIFSSISPASDSLEVSYLQVVIYFAPILASMCLCMLCFCFCLVERLKLIVKGDHKEII